MLSYKFFTREDGTIYCDLVDNTKTVATSETYEALVPPPEPTESAPEPPLPPETPGPLEEQDRAVLVTFPCPHCQFSAASNAGLAAHKRARHK